MLDQSHNPKGRGRHRRSNMPAYEFVTDILRPYVRESSKEKKPRTQETDAKCCDILESAFKGYWVGRESVCKNMLDVRTVRKFRMELDLSERRKDRIMAVGSAACNYAVKWWEYILDNPFVVLGRSRKAVLPPSRKRYLTQHEESKLLLASDAWLRGIITFALNTGCRVTEIIELTWDRVQGDEIVFTPGTQKSGVYGRRALNDAAAQIIARQPQFCEYVFTLGGGKIPRRKLHDMWDRARVKAGLEDVKFHDLRKTCGQRMLEAGAPLTAVQAQLGHNDIATTQESYVEPSVTLAKEWVKKLAGNGL